MALVRALTGLRQQVLSHVRVPVNASCLALPAAGTYLISLRRFADSTYLDKSEVTDRIINVIKNFDNIKNPEKITPEVSFNDLGLDSLDVVELVMAFEEEFGIEIPDAEADKILTAPEAISYISAHPMAK